MVGRLSAHLIQTVELCGEKIVRSIQEVVIVNALLALFGIDVLVSVYYSL